jgi:hypothetical protein
MKAYELLAEPAAWTQGATARDVTGLALDVGVGAREASRSSFAVCWCAMGAILACYEDCIPFSEAAEKFGALMNHLTIKKGIFVTQWNDDPARTHAEVLGVLKDLDI